MRNYNIPIARMSIIKTLAHYANEVSARVAVIKRKYILYGVEERGRERERVKIRSKSNTMEN